MNPASPLQLALTASAKGVLSVAFKGKSAWEDIPLFKEAIDVRLNPKSKVKKAIFDLSEIDPFLNAAGRLLDLACEYFKRCQIPVEIKIPSDIYATLREIEPQRMPVPSQENRATVRGVTVWVIPPAEETTAPAGEMEGAASLGADWNPEVVEETQTILSCAGKVRAVNGSVISVSLFTQEEEIVGEFDRKQFSNPEIVPGMMFEYQAYITAPGQTIVTIDLLTEQYPTHEELMDDAKALGVDFRKF